MAYIRRRDYPSGKSVYIVGFRDQYGRWHEKAAGARRKDAEALLRRIGQEIAEGTYGQEREDPTFSEFAARFLTAKEGGIKLSTLDDYQQVIHNHLNPFFGRMRLSGITPLKVQGFLAWEGERGISPATTGKAFRVLKVILRQALAWELIGRDPTSGVRGPRQERKEMDFLTPEETTALLEAAEGETRDIIAVAALAGLRQGEIFALRWGDIDLEASSIQVVRAYRNGRFTEPKTAASRRAVPISGHLERILRARYEAAGAPRPEDLVFPSQAGGPLDRANFITRSFEPALAAAGLRRIRFHDLRHTYASLAISAGMDPKGLQRAMGHSSIMVTMDTYAHLFPGAHEAALRRLDATLDAVRGGKVISLPGPREGRGKGGN